MQFIRWVAMVDGITTIVTTSILFRWFRNQRFFYLDEDRKTKTMLGKLFHCPMCFGFWVGGLIFLLAPFFEPWGLQLALLPGPSLMDLTSFTVVKLFVFFIAFLLNGAGAASLCWTTHLVRMKINETLGL